MPFKDIESAYQDRDTFVPPSKRQIKAGSVVHFAPALYTLRSRARYSASSGVGARTILQTRGSPRLYANYARTSASPSILSVFARRRRETAIDAGSIPCGPQNTMEDIESSLLNDYNREVFRPVRACAFLFSSAKQASIAATSLPTTICFDIFSARPGDSDVISHFDRTQFQ